MAYLHEYKDDGTLGAAIVGYHFFANPGGVDGGGSGAGWTIGTGCRFDSCVTSTATWRGKSPQADSQAANGNISWLLVTADTENISGSGPLAAADYLQRLDTLDGVAPPTSECATAADIGKRWNSPYETDYIFSVCGAKRSMYNQCCRGEEKTSWQVNLNNGGCGC